MALPIAPNTTCDVYRNGNAPPASPDVPAVPCHLTADYLRREETGESEGTSWRYTHVLLADVNADIRDQFSDWAVGAGDTVYVPDMHGTAFRVVCVEVRGRGGPGAVRRVYLDRHLPSWPTNNL